MALPKDTARKRYKVIFDNVTLTSAYQNCRRVEVEGQEQAVLLFTYTPTDVAGILEFKFLFSTDSGWCEEVIENRSANPVAIEKVSYTFTAESELGSPIVSRFRFAIPLGDTNMIVAVKETAATAGTARVVLETSTAT